MSVLIDTPVWSLALRRKAAQLSVAERQLVAEWKTLIFDGRARLAGIIRQEVLSGVREARDFQRLRERLAAFDDVPAGAADHECAASYFNACRAKGVTPTAFDVLICALAARHGLTIFTTDTDFTCYGLCGLDHAVTSNHTHLPRRARRPWPEIEARMAGWRRDGVTLREIGRRSKAAASPFLLGPWTQQMRGLQRPLYGCRVAGDYRKKHPRGPSR